MNKITLASLLLCMSALGPVTRLYIKPYQWWNEALHGVALIKGF